MTDDRRHRGPHPEDPGLFGESNLASLRQATSDLCWLLDRGYVLASSLKLVGDRYALTSRQRTAVSRCACTQAQRERRTAHRCDPRQLAGQILWVDGYNVLTSLEAALSGGVLIRGVDGCLRDMASMHGTYRKVDETTPALVLIGVVLFDWKLDKVRWLFDQPVSNSGRLRSLMQDLARENKWNWEIDLVPDPDPILASANVCVATADSEILNHTSQWVNLVDLIVAERIPKAWIADCSIRPEG